MSGLGQSSRGSLVEALFNTAVGYTINFTANLCIFPLFGMHISIINNLYLGFLYTIISIVRGYFIRRFFNTGTLKIFR
jgi:hypothetical protein